MNHIQDYLEYLEKEWENLPKAPTLSRVQRWAMKFKVHPLKSALEFASSHVLPKIFPNGFLAAAKTFWGETMLINFISSSGLYVHGYYPVPDEIRLAQYLLRTLDETSVFFDVGANIGFFSKLAAWRIGIPNHVHAFEPSPHNFDILRRNSNNRMVINHKGCSDKEGVADFYEFAEAFKVGESTMHSEYYPTEGFSAMKVKVVTLDKYSADHDILPDIVKIDVEGHEPEVLCGMTNLLERHDPQIVMEIWKGEKGGRHRKAVRFLIDNSYLPHRIGKYGILETISLDSFQSYISVGMGYDNIVFIKSTA